MTMTTTRTPAVKKTPRSKNGQALRLGGMLFSMGMEDGSSHLVVRRMGSNGLPVERTKEDYPYSFDEYVLWDSGKESRSGTYSDRLYQQDPAKYDRLCLKYFGNTAHTFSARPTAKIAAFLKEFFDFYADFKLTRVCHGCNPGSGFPYWRFDYTYSHQLVTEAGKAVIDVDAKEVIDAPVKALLQ